MGNASTEHIVATPLLAESRSIAGRNFPAPSLSLRVNAWIDSKTLDQPSSMPRNPKLAASLYDTRFAENKSSGARVGLSRIPEGLSSNPEGLSRDFGGLSRDPGSLDRAEAARKDQARKALLAELLGELAQI